jgi:hypothetical protein
VSGGPLRALLLALGIYLIATGAMMDDWWSFAVLLPGATLIGAYVAWSEAA